MFDYFFNFETIKGLCYLLSFLPIFLLPHHHSSGRGRVNPLTVRTDGGMSARVFACGMHLVLFLEILYSASAAMTERNVKKKKKKRDFMAAAVQCYFFGDGERIRIH